MKNFFIKKIQKLSGKSCQTHESESVNIDTLPLEVFDTILSILPVHERLKCRLLSTLFLKRIDALFHHEITFHLNDQIYSKYNTAEDWNISPVALSIDDTLKKKISKQFIASRIYTVQVLEISSTISTKNFYRIVSGLPQLQTLIVTSRALGGEIIFPGSTHPDTVSDKYWCNFKELRIKLEYIPSSEKYFSTDSLVSNLLGMYKWNATSLKKISFQVISSMFSEQFYFTFDLFLKTIPKLSYGCLEELHIVAPRMRPFKFSTFGLRDDISSIQLTVLKLTSSSSEKTFSPDVISFIQSQRKLKLLQFQIKESTSPLREVIINELRKVNPHVEVQY